ncbi:hypothetical protein BOS5A_231404 [Bosea sp. EC-HK365B]|nr:hypothetical protein BOSE7B_50024 [Bosea sp. 7B]CAD5300433.1 hypothetical protein BOSE21B_91475 [Bosea sp. 21B]VVT62136.1 hypothetical protein BOS5A_231404 [Bosea sp. EC-HK365B]VXC96196.1 hypothetical protein BOSE127_90024 [Bosea sp. 127]
MDDRSSDRLKRMICTGLSREEPEHVACRQGTLGDGAQFQPGTDAELDRGGLQRLALASRQCLRNRERLAGDGLSQGTAIERGGQAPRCRCPRHPLRRARIRLRLARGLHPRLPRSVRGHAG